MELLAALLFLSFEGFIFWGGWMIGWNRCCRHFERLQRKAKRCAGS
jgi:hypothetical protein